MLTVALSVYKKFLSTDCQGRRGQPLDRSLPSPQHTHQHPNKANVPFHQPGLFTGFWVVSRRTSLPFLAFSGQPWNYHSTCQGEKGVNFCVTIKV